jgi:CDP-4-dehydro-6-deoxyglucose reductase, E3
VLQARPYTATLVAAQPLSPRVRSLRFALSCERFDFSPGQFVSFVVPLPELGQDNVRSYSVASYPDGSNLVEIAVTHVRGGPGSTWLHGLAPGAEVNLSGPYGFFTLEQPPPAPLCFVATGTGITPVRPMLRRVFEAGTDRDVTLIFGVRHEEDILYGDEFSALGARHPNFRFLPTLTRPAPSWTGGTGRVQVHVDRLLVEPRRTDADVYVCGLRRMVDDVHARLKAAGWDRKKLHQERYD